jgi:hypothetical protein
VGSGSRISRGGWSVARWQWDKIIIDKGELTLRGFLDAFKEQTGLNVSMLFHGASNLEGPQKGKMLYNADEYAPSNRKLYQDKMNTPLKVRHQTPRGPRRAF